MRFFYSFASGSVKSGYSLLKLGCSAFDVQQDPRASAAEDDDEHEDENAGEQGREHPH